jgi:hypothetical protein
VKKQKGEEGEDVFQKIPPLKHVTVKVNVKE